MSNYNSASLIHCCCCAEDVLRSNMMDIDRPVTGTCTAMRQFTCFRRLLLSSDKNEPLISVPSKI